MERTNSIGLSLVLLLALSGSYQIAGQSLSYPIVETGVHQYYNNSQIIGPPSAGSAFYGQDAQYQGNEPSYTDNGDGTITDNVTGLMWQKDMGVKITYQAALMKADTMTLGGHTDWRIPRIKELYSLILFTGMISGPTLIKYIDTVYFDQPFGDTTIGERIIDAQTWSSTHYKSLTMAGDSTVFGVNFIDGRIKGYPKYQPGTGNSVPRVMYFRMVRGNANYGVNNYIDNQDGTISDLSTGLMWQKSDDGTSRDWETALSYAENLNLAGHSDWRLPNAKELQSIVDYSRCPDYTNSAAIDPMFNTTQITDPNGNPQFPYFWSSTTHLDGPNPFVSAVYVAFGEAQGKMNGTLMDVHGAGAQRSDPKTGNPNNYPAYVGPQGDLQYVFNYVRCVRNDSISIGLNEEEDLRIKMFPNPSAGSVEVIHPGGLIRMEVYDSKARLTDSKESDGTGRTEFHIQSPGIYSVRFVFPNKIITKKLIVI